jgi:predicted RecB family nuclease
MPQLTCPVGHVFFKSSTCTTCPVCAAAAKPDDGFMAVISAPARRALENHQIRSLDELCVFSEKELLQLHGIGKSALTALKTILEKEGRCFKA